MFTIVSIQNMLLDYTSTAKYHTSWDVQIRWEKVNFNDHGHESLEDLLKNLALTEENSDPAWFRSQMKKKIAERAGKYTFTNEFHDAGNDFATSGSASVASEADSIASGADFF